MSREHLIRRLLRFVFIWALGSLISYGHILKEFKSEEAAECHARRQANPMAHCTDTTYMEAWFASVFAWPYHWSEELWK